MRRVRRWVVLAGLLAVVGAVIAYRLTRPTGVVAEPVVRGRAVEAVYATGTVEPIERVVVKARFSEHVARVLAKEGDRVTRGQLLAEIENPVRRNALTEGETQLAKARQQAGPRSPQLATLEAQVRALAAELDLARAELARSEQLGRSGATTRSELDAARARVQQLEAQLAAATAQQQSARLELGATSAQIAAQVKSLASEADEGAVTSPIEGIVLRKDIEAGEVVAQNQEMFEVADTSTLLVELHVDEADIARVRDARDGHPGSTVALSFYAFPGRAFAGTVAEILPEPDRVRRSYTVKVRLDAPIEGLRVGMTAEANIVIQRKDGALLAPAEAIDGTSAWFVEDGRAVRRPVTFGIRDLTRAELVTGAKEGDLAILDPGGLRDGQRVTATVRGR